MVYVLDCHVCVSGFELVKWRNSLFTAITRSRAWVRLCGIGPRMDTLIAEVEKVAEHDFLLDFTVPTPDELVEMRMIHRERTRDERARGDAAIKSRLA